MSWRLNCFKTGCLHLLIALTSFTPAPCLWKPPICSLYLWVQFFLSSSSSFFFKILYIIEIIRCLSFYVWLISLDMVPSRPIQVVTRGRISFFYSWIIFHWMWELNCEESWALKNWFFLTVVLEKTLESLGLQGDPTSPSWKRSILGVHWKDWCWSWNSSTLAISCEKLTHCKRPWCWEGLGAGGEEDVRG